MYHGSQEAGSTYQKDPGGNPWKEEKQYISIYYVQKGDTDLPVGITVSIITRMVEDYPPAALLMAKCEKTKDPRDMEKAIEVYNSK
jgi:hypothetical protein